MDINPPARLVDPTRGTVSLRLIPFYVERLHKGAELADAAALSIGLPFPFLKDSEPLDLLLQSGMTTGTIASHGGGFEPNSSLGSRSWWRWAAYALTPFGWVTFPTPFFDNGRLTELTLQRHGKTPAENHAVMREWLTRELGDASGPASWLFEWGEVKLYRDARDGEAQMRVVWELSS